MRKVPGAFQAPKFLPWSSLFSLDSSTSIKILIYLKLYLEKDFMSQKTIAKLCLLAICNHIFLSVLTLNSCYIKIGNSKAVFREFKPTRIVRLKKTDDK